MILYTPKEPTGANAVDDGVVNVQVKPTTRDEQTETHLCKRQLASNDVIPVQLTHLHLRTYMNM